MTVVPRLPERFTEVEPLASTPLERTFRARDTMLQRDVLLRLPPANAWSGWSAPVRERLLREARVLAKVQHDAIVPILWVEETEEGPLLVMPPPEGERLTERLQHGTLSVEAAVALGVRIAEALACVHFHQVVHRGVGPDAIWILSDGRCKLGSFTFAKAYDARLPSSIDHRRRSDPDAAQLLPPYPAPEQLAGRPAEPRVDVFALGCTLFRCLAGVDAEQGAAGGRADVRAHRKDVPAAFAEVLRTCMQPAPTARYPNAQALVTALQQLRNAAKGGGGLSRRTVAAGGVAAVALGALGLWQPWATGGSERSDSGTVQAAGGGATAETKYSDTYAHGHALLIGVGEGRNGWPHAKLNGPANEVEAVKQKLLALNPKFWGEKDAIKTLVNEEATKSAIMDELKRLHTLGTDDCVFVYFAGHGVDRDQSGRFWLVCADATKKSADDGDHSDAGFIPKEELIDFTRLTETTSKEFKHMFVVLDCCFGGKVFDDVGDRGRPVDERKDASSPLLRHRTREFLTSVSADLTARDAPVGGISTFCREFLTALTPTDPQVRFVAASSIHDRILQRMPAAQPMYGNLAAHSRGRFLFFVQPAPTAPK